MTGAQVTFLVVTAGVSTAGTALVYPGVRKHARSPKDCFLAAFMASALAGVTVGLVASSLVNALSVALG